MALSPSERHARAGEVFLAACELDGEAREALLARECADDAELLARVRELLAGEERSDGRLEESALRWVGLDRPEGTPERIGHYRVEGELGRGGMGVVYAAQQAEPRRRVAVKVLASGLVSGEHLKRFQQEAAVLGWLNHPGIAQIHEAGRAEELGGRPFFAMELVEGVPLTEYARREGLDLRARSELLARVCDAVRHAHGKGVIHRDLKPANILVDASGQPKILDFGVARAVDAELQMSTLQTTAGELVGTLAYMSPEQVRADPEQLDARSDVYSLGVVAYELYAGKLPVDVLGAPVPEAIRRVLEDEPSRLHTLRGELAGDVDTIVAKALEKDPDRRYASVDDLASDLRRFLRDEPIVARPPSTLYQLQKFARRNRVLVGGVAATIVALAAGLAVSLGLWLRTEEALKKEKEALAAESAALANETAALEKESAALASEKAALARADEALAKADETIASLTEVQRTFGRMLRAPNPMVGPSEVKMLDVLESAVTELEGAFLDRPSVRAWLLDNLGLTFLGLGVHGRAAELLEEALELREALGESALLRGRTRRLLANALRDLGRPEEALALYAEARANFAELPDVPVDDLAQVAFDEGVLRLGRGEHDLAVECFSAALERMEDALRRVDERRAAMLNGLSRAYWGKGDQEEAERYAIAALEELGDRGGMGTMIRLQATNSLAAVAHARNDWAECVRLSEAALAEMRTLAGDEHPYVAALLSNVAMLKRGMGDLDGALADYRDVVRYQEGNEPGRRAELGHALATIARLHLMRGESEEAEVASRRAVEEMRVDSRASGRVDALVDVLHARHDVLRLADDTEGARAALEEALELSDGVHLADRYMHVRLPLSMAYLEVADERWESAADWALRAERRAEGLGDTQKLLGLSARSLRVACLVELGELDEALATATATAERVADPVYEGQTIRHQARGDLAWVRWSRGDREGQADELRAAVEGLDADLGDVEVTRRYRALLESL